MATEIPPLITRTGDPPEQPFSSQTANMSDDERPAREVKNHLLFEIATEVAHRGKLELP
jgi:hypothetical protein